jgi:ABC-type transport system involved in multi-copper enzyme maturation permease subunit
MIEMVRRSLRQKFGSPAITIALGVIALLTAFSGATTDPERALGTGFVAIVLLAAGSVSKDASGGALQMILTRPIPRTTYLFGRFFGILAAYALFLALTGALTVLLASVLPRVAGASAPSQFSMAALGRGLTGAFLDSLLFAAILLFFSTFLRGYADVLAYVVLSILLSLLPGFGVAIRKPWLQRGAEQLRKNVLPDVDWSEVLRGRHVLAEPTGRWVLAVTVFLILAAVIFSRREFTYGHD